MLTRRSLGRYRYAAIAPCYANAIVPMLLTSLWLCLANAHHATLRQRQGRTQMPHANASRHLTPLQAPVRFFDL